MGAECSVVDYMVAIEIGVYHTLGDANCLANHCSWRQLLSTDLLSVPWVCII